MRDMLSPMREGRPPEGLARVVSESCEPVHPLPSPSRRSAPFAVVGLAVGAAVPLAYELRVDAGAIGLLGLWGAFALQNVAALLLVTMAVHESVPGTLCSWTGIVAGLAGALGLIVGVTWVTANASPFWVADTEMAAYFVYCFLHLLGLGFVPLGMAMLVLVPGLTTRPAIAGLIAGCAAGLAADAGWRLFCHASDPRHVLSSHLLGVVAIALTGSIAGRALLRPKPAPGGVRV